ncbi:MAG: HNH endonuclease signature motif containing protein [Clostridium sp.]
MPHKYTREQSEFITENVIGVSNAKLTEIFNSRFETNLEKVQIKNYKNRNHLSSGLDGRFTKGHVPANKGIKGVIYEGSKKTWFKKGSTPVNHRSLGSERVTVDGYTEIKVAEPNKWRLKHQILHEECVGPIPRNHAVIFGDGDKSNFDISNLILVSRQQLLILNRNKLIQNDANLTRTAVIIADLYQKISRRKD